MGLIYDIKAIKERDPAARSSLEVILLYPGFQAVMWHRLAHALYKGRLFFLARLVSQLVKFFTGIEIHPGAKIGKGVFIDHGTGVVIGETAVVGDNCTIYQNSTLGGTGKETGKRHPTLGERVMVGAGAKVLGPITIGAGSKIAAGAVVLGDVQPGSTCVGVPARTVKIDGRKVEDLDQIHLPDPISMELCRMRAEIEKLRKELEQHIDKEQKS
ncbi:MAG: serine O-acetyltransferase EpsC [Monoglobales bacterium]